MPLYPYRCEAGHESDEFFHMQDEKPWAIPCATCGQPATRAVVLPTIRADIPEHFNETLGMTVRGRTHLKTLQHDLGCQDFEPSSKLREELDESRAKALHKQGRGRVSAGGPR